MPVRLPCLFLSPSLLCSHPFSFCASILPTGKWQLKPKGCKSQSIKVMVRDFEETTCHLPCSIAHLPRPSVASSFLFFFFFIPANAPEKEWRRKEMNMRNVAGISDMRKDEEDFGGSRLLVVSPRLFEQPQTFFLPPFLSHSSLLLKRLFPRNKQRCPNHRNYYSLLFYFSFFLFLACKSFNQAPFLSSRDFLLGKEHGTGMQ